MNGCATNANPACIDQAVAAHEQCEREEEDCGCGTVAMHSGEELGKIDEAAKEGGEEKEIEHAQPDGGNFIEERDKRICKPKAQQGGQYECEGKHEESVSQCEGCGGAQAAGKKDYQG